MNNKVSLSREDLRMGMDIVKAIARDREAAAWHNLSR